MGGPLSVGETPHRRQPRIHAAWLIVPCLAADGLMVPSISLIEDSPPNAILAVVPFALGIVGCVLAQGTLLAAWLAWGEGRFLRRLLTHWEIAASLYLIWLVGFWVAVGSDGEAPLAAFTVALGVPLVSLGAQFPLCVARQWFGWRLVRENADHTQPVEPPLAIRDLMLATLVVAAALALARLAPIFQDEDPTDVWPAWGVAVTAASVISSIAILPAGALLLRSPSLRRGLIWSGAYAAAWIALVWIMVAILLWFGVQLPPWVLFVGLSNLMFTFAATLTLTAVIARDRGYRLTSRRVPSRTGRVPG